MANFKIAYAKGDAESMLIQANLDPSSTIPDILLEFQAGFPLKEVAIGYAICVMNFKKELSSGPPPLETLDVPGYCIIANEENHIEAIVVGCKDDLRVIAKLMKQKPTEPESAYEDPS